MLSHIVENLFSLIFGDYDLEPFIDLLNPLRVYELLWLIFEALKYYLLKGDVLLFQAVFHLLVQVVKFLSEFKFIWRQYAILSFNLFFICISIVLEHLSD
jgi:hypothetical protein